MGSVVQKEAWVGPLDWLDDQIKVIDNDGGDMSTIMVTMIVDDDDDRSDLLTGLMIKSRW